MANLSRTQKRVRAIFPRASDGSAFQKCNECGISVAIALAEMHECEQHNKEVKRFKGTGFDVDNKKQNLWDKLIVMAPFHFFMKEYTKTSKSGDWVEINSEGFEAWKNMSEQERKPYVEEADKIDKAYQKALLKESYDGALKVDDEADSANTTVNNVKCPEFDEESNNEYSLCPCMACGKPVRSGSWHTEHCDEAGQWCWGLFN